MSTDTERRELVRPDATVAYWVNGPDRAPLVVLLHGATLDHHAWDPHVEALATRYRVVLPTCAGTGNRRCRVFFGSTTRSTTSRPCWTRSTTGRHSCSAA